MHVYAFKPVCCGNFTVKNMPRVVLDYYLQVANNNINLDALAQISKGELTSLQVQ